MDNFHCIECGADISDLPAKCPKCGHGYNYELERPSLGFWSSFWAGFRKNFWWLIAAALAVSGLIYQI